jgi:acetyltransferase-like isoleucine patch superfamily enzyme
MIGKLHRTLGNYLWIKLGMRLYKLRNRIAQKNLPAFANNPQNLVIDLPRRLKNPDRITIGDDVSLGPGTFITATTLYPSQRMQHSGKVNPAQTFDPQITIGNRVSATSDLQLAAVKEIIIEDDVMFASNVHVNDSSHGYDNANIPYKYQPLKKIAPIRIKHGCWIGQNAIILSGVTIGELSIIGANAVVTHDIPPRCIAMGSPARVVKQWDEIKQQWTVMAGKHKEE